MARSVPKCKRAAYVYDRDFIVVDDISGVLKMRSECAIDGYGFLSSQGDMRNPQEIPPIINEQMAAWPDPRPIGQPVFTPSPDYVYFIFNYAVFDVINGSSSFDATTSISFDAPISSIVWSVDGVYSATGWIVTLPMSDGLHDIQAILTDTDGNTTTFVFEYTHPHVAVMTTVVDYQFNGTDGATTTTDSTGHTTCSGLGVTSGSQYAYIQSNNLLQARKDVVIDNSGSLSPFLTFESDFEIEIRNKFVDPYAFYAVNVLKLTTGDAYYFSLNIFATGLIGLSYNGSSGFTIEGYGAAINVYQTYKLKRVAGLLSLYIDDVLKGSVYNTSVMNGGRIILLGADGDRYVDYLTIKKA